MKKIILVGLLMFGFTHIHVLQAGDDVYDAPTPKKVKVQVQRQAPVQEQSVPYYEDNNGRQQRNFSNQQQSNNYQNQDNDYQGDDYQYDNNYIEDDWNYSYSDRLRRFHNPSLRFSYGWSSCNNSWNDPFYNSFNNNCYNSFTPNWS